MAKKKTQRKSTKTKSVTAVPFEESLEKLRQIVAQLENGNLSLSESLEQYEKGVASLKQCYEALNSAQRRIEMLVELDEGGNLVTRPFDNTASAEITEGSRRNSRSSTTRNAHDEDLEDEYDEEEDDDEDMDDPNSLF